MKTVHNSLYIEYAAFGRQTQHTRDIVKHMEKTIEYIENWLKENRPEVLPTLNKAASEKEISDFESHFGIKIPEDMKIFYKKYNGQDCSEVFNSAIIEPGTDGLMSLEDIKKCYNELKKFNKLYPIDIDENNVDEKIKPVYQNDKWLPLISEGNGDYFFLDLDPQEKGNLGQIIHHKHEGPKIEIMASDFKSWFRDFIKYCLE